MDLELRKEHVPVERLHKGDVFMYRIYSGGRGPCRVESDPRRIGPDDPIYDVAPRTVRLSIRQLDRADVEEGVPFGLGCYVLKFHRPPYPAP